MKVIALSALSALCWLCACVNTPLPPVTATNACPVTATNACPVPRQWTKEEQKQILEEEKKLAPNSILIPVLLEDFQLRAQLKANTNREKQP